MINLNPIINTKILFKGNNKDNKPAEKISAEKNNVESPTKALTSYGKALVFRGEKAKTYYDKLDEIDLIPDDETISLKEAVEIIKPIKMANARKIDTLMFSCFETNSSEIAISKKVLKLIIANTEHKKMFPKVIDAIKTCMDDETQTFDYNRYNSLIDYKGRVKISAKLYNDFSAINRRGGKTERRYEIMKSIEGIEGTDEKKEEIRKLDVTYADIFKPLSETKKELLDKLDNLKKEKEIPKELHAQLKDSIVNNKFNFKEIYKEYYKPLKEMSTIKEVNKKYPEINIPPKPSGGSSVGDSLAYRLSKEDYDAVSLDIVRQAYSDYKSRRKIIVKLQNSNPTSIYSLMSAGFNYSLPSDSVKDFINQGDIIRGKLKTIQEMPLENLKEMSRKNGVNSSKIWSDYAAATKGKWMPVRLIRAKKVNPESSKYSTPYLVDTYIYSLYKENPNKIYQTRNPLEKYDDKQILSRGMFLEINKIYKNRYFEIQNDMRFRRDLTAFTSQFDRDAIGQSIEKMEKKYTNYFYTQYLTKEKKENLQKEIQKSYDTALEKYNLVSSYDKNSIEITEEDIINEIDEKL